MEMPTWALVAGGTIGAAILKMLADLMASDFLKRATLRIWKAIARKTPNKLDDQLEQDAEEALLGKKLEESETKEDPPK